MTTGAYLILVTFGGLMFLIGHLDRRSKRVVSNDEADVLGFLSRVSETLAANKPDQELQTRMGITQRRK